MHRYWMISCWVLVLLALAVGLFDMARHSMFELHGTWSGDADIYFAMGRGILNGLTPYRDLFENKPPGIFVVTMLSLWLGSGVWLAKILQIASLISMFMAPTTWGFLAAKNAQQPWLMRSIGSLLGILFMLFTATYAGEIQVETFGLAFAMWYPVLLYHYESRWNVQQSLVATFLIACSVGFKEPFLLPIFATSLLMSRDRWSFVRTFVVPTLFAGIIGFLILTILGWLEPYLHVYLSMMFGSHVVRTGPLWTRGFELTGMLMQAWNFAWMLPIFLITVFIGAFGYLPGPLWQRILRLGGGVYLILFAIGLGGFYFMHHYLFPLPMYLACAMMTLRYINGPSRKRSIAALTTIILLCLTILFHTRLDLSKLATDGQADAAMKLRVAAVLDTVLDRCHEERYTHLVNKGGGPYGWTTHSPVGPVFLHYTRFPIPGNDIGKLLQESRIVLFLDDEQSFLSTKALSYFHTKYSATPWPCAGEFEQPKPYTILFRNDAAK